MPGGPTGKCLKIHTVFVSSSAVKQVNSTFKLCNPFDCDDDAGDDTDIIIINKFRPVPGCIIAIYLCNSYTDTNEEQ